MGELPDIGGAVLFLAIFAVIGLIATFFGILWLISFLMTHLQWVS
jgi:hypothetical protein